MKLSELVRLKRSVENWAPSTYEFTVNQSLQSLSDSVVDNDAMTQQLKDSIHINREKINDSFADIRQSIKDYKQYIQEQINALEPQYVSLSKSTFQGSINDSPEYILNRRKESQIFNSEEGKELFINRLGVYNSWQYPAIEIRPAFGEITEYLKGCTPLYLVDTHDDLFQEVKKLWNNIYQRRLRYYTFDESDTASLDTLPDNQIGLVCSVDYFNFKPIEIIESMLQQIYKKLRPGGVVMFTYNNCDLPFGVRNVENFYACYTPHSQLAKTVENIGYEIIKSIDVQENISWMEIKKPGEIYTIRGGETLGEILSFN